MTVQAMTAGASSFHEAVPGTGSSGRRKCWDWSRPCAPRE
jgi:hypothetical protein